MAETTTRGNWIQGWGTPSLRVLFIVAGISVAVVLPRLLWDRFLDPFEDGFQNWWIASSLAETGIFADRYSGMTRGNWLPGYSFFGAGLIALFGSHIMPLLKAANILFSLGTTAMVYLLARPRGRVTAALAATLLALSPTDIVISSFATPEALTLFGIFSGVFFVERRPFGTRRSLPIAALAFLAASTLRYETWGFVGLYLLWTWRLKQVSGRDLLLLGAPVLAFAAGWWLWTSQYGFLPSIIISQTSTDLRYKESIGSLAPLSDRLITFFSWYLEWTPFALVAIAWAAIRERKSPFTIILAFFYGAEIVYTAAGFGNPGPRYIHLTIPIVCVYSSSALVAIKSRIALAPRRIHESAQWAPIYAAVAVSLLLTVQVVNPSPPPGFLLGGMERAGKYLSALPLPEGKLLVSESPIAAYYSGYPASRILGSFNLPLDSVNASAFLAETAAYVVMVTVPYYRLRLLFPDQANGSDGNHLVLLYDATGAEFEYGAPRVLVFSVVP